ncbi:hypothetical protein JTB14_027932, partial [Gonioctena quinquepunctata]
WIIISLDIK